MVQTDSSHTAECREYNTHQEHIVKIELKENGISSTLLPAHSPNNDEHSIHSNRSTVQEKCNALANIKTASMLFVVSLVFIVAFLPAWLMALQIVPYLKIVFYSYFVYNVANPFIYAFMNPTFRRDSQNVLNHCISTN